MKIVSPKFALASWILIGVGAAGDAWYLTTGPGKQHLQTLTEPRPKCAHDDLLPPHYRKPPQRHNPPKHSHSDRFERSSRLNGR